MDSLDDLGLEYGDCVKSKAHPEWGQLSVHTLEGRVIVGGWINTHGRPANRPEGIDVDDMVIVKRNNISVGSYSDF